MTERLYRSPDDRVIAGVAGGLATWLKIDPSLVRIAWVLLAIFTGGLFVLVYIVMMIVVPLPPAGWVPQAAPGPVPGWGQPPPAPGAPGPAPALAPAPGPVVSPSVSGNAGIVGGAVLIILGAWFLVDQYVHINWDLVWPVVVIVFGAVLIAVAARRSRVT